MVGNGGTANEKERRRKTKRSDGCLGRVGEGEERAACVV